MNVLLAAVLAVQQPQVSASVDRVDALVGDLITLSIRVDAVGDQPIRVIDPALGGFEVRGTSEATQVRFVDGAARRTYTRELRLIALRPGTATIGPVRVRQGDEVVETAPLTVTVTAPAAGVVPTLAPRLRALVDSVRPPAGGEEVVLRAVALPTTLVLGSQLDLITLAWFRRDVRRRLRTPPTLTPPTVERVWAYDQTTPTGIVTSRRSGQWWYDLFVSHQVLFPLIDGPLVVGPATVSYVVPLSYSFLSREVQHEVRSDSLRVTVAPQPVADRPPDYVGAAGSDLALDVTVSPTRLEPGGAATAVVSLEGRGNVALWPEPTIRWPVGLRVYPTDVTVDLAPRDGQVAGRKRFTYLLVADSVGAHPIPAVSYPYFDPATRRYARAGAAGSQVVAPLADRGGTRPLPPPLRTAVPPETLGAVLNRAPDAVWLAVLLLPPLLAAAARWPRRRWRTSPGRDPDPEETRAGRVLDDLDREFRRAVAAIVRNPLDRQGPALAAALRAAGLEPSLATHAVRVRDRLHQAVFGPAGSTDADELAQEVREVLRALAGEISPRSRARLLPLALLVLTAASAQAQQPTAETLYEAGAVRPAADAFLARARAAPRVAVHWYHLGNALYRLGDDGRARTAWVRAARLAPRMPEVRRALRLLPADPTTDRLTRVPPVTPGEGFAAAGFVWIVGWTLIALKRVRRAAWGAVGLGLAGLVAAQRLEAHQTRAVGIVVVPDAPLREAPFGSAQATRVVHEGGAVLLERREGPWWLVARGDTRGWLLVREIARL